MTVGELIEELQKHPTHYIALMSVNVPDMDSGGSDWELMYISSVELQTNVGDIGNVVKIESAE